MTTQPIFDVHQSEARRAIVRLIIAPGISIAIIVWGIYLLPANFSLWPKIEDLKDWDFWTVAGLFMITGSSWRLIKEAIFAYRSQGASGEWHFQLTDDHLTWDVPDHAHGQEIGFRANLSEIKEIEFRTRQRHDELNLREYWIHFHDRHPIELQDYSGVSLSWLVSKVCEQGVQYNETQIIE